jgi:phosphoribosylanthranilate isomerase
MPVRVKICGITSAADALAAAEAGADALGFILYPKSKRHVAPEKVRALVEELPPYVQRVAVTVNAAPEEIAAMEKLAVFDVWQLHGDETPESVRSLRPRRLVKALHLPLQAGHPRAEAYAVDALLLDTPSPEYGGTGKTFDWKLAAEFRAQAPKPLILSGGLTPENVAEAIGLVQPYAVDVSSGVEANGAPGKKDHAKLRDFIQACKAL